MNSAQRTQPAARVVQLLRPWTTPLDPEELLRTFRRTPATQPATSTSEQVTPTPLINTQPAVRWGDVVAESNDDETILDALERNNERPVVGCRRGVCRRCVTPILAGQVRDQRDERDVDAGTHVRICVSAAITDVELEPTLATDRTPTLQTTGAQQ